RFTPYTAAGPNDTKPSTVSYAPAVDKPVTSSATYVAPVVTTIAYAPARQGRIRCSADTKPYKCVQPTPTPTPANNKPNVYVPPVVNWCKGCFYLSAPIAVIAHFNL
ncbi:UNVERIFIED_CONTAM: hypothetical protein HDU68_010422, partial [Siphonaria sp. JEL0065]